MMHFFHLDLHIFVRYLFFLATTPLKPGIEINWAYNRTFESLYHKMLNQDFQKSWSMFNHIVLTKNIFN